MGPPEHLRELNRQLLDPSRFAMHIFPTSQIADFQKVRGEGCGVGGGMHSGVDSDLDIVYKMLVERWC